MRKQGTIKEITGKTAGIICFRDEYGQYGQPIYQKWGDKDDENLFDQQWEDGDKEDFLEVIDYTDVDSVVDHIKQVTGFDPDDLLEVKIRNGLRSVEKSKKLADGNDQFGRVYYLRRFNGESEGPDLMVIVRRGFKM